MPQRPAPSALLWPEEHLSPEADVSSQTRPGLRIAPSHFNQRVADWPVHYELDWTESPSTESDESMPNPCECGCGQDSTREFLPGHDQKLRVALESRVGGLLSLREFIVQAENYASGAISEAQLLQHVRSTFAALRRAGVA